VSRAAFEPTSETPLAAPPPQGAHYPPPYGADYPEYSEYPAAAAPSGGGRRRAPTRALGGPVGIAAIIAAILVVFGLGAVAVSIFRTDAPQSAQPPAEAPTPVDSPTEPALPSADPSPSTSASPSRSAGARPSGGAITGDPRQEERVVTLVNREREEAGCKREVRMDDRLRDAARAHSRDMATRGFFSHTGSDGSSPEERMREAGYGRPLSENLARGPDSAEDVVRAWMRSSEHRRNIVDCDARGIGVGLAVRNGTPYWTQVFGR